jgi:hypothetical protein
VDHGLFNDAASSLTLFGLELCCTGGGASHVLEILRKTTKTVGVSTGIGTGHLLKH